MLSRLQDSLPKYFPLLKTDLKGTIHSYLLIMECASFLKDYKFLLCICGGWGIEEASPFFLWISVFEKLILFALQAVCQQIPIQLDSQAGSANHGKAPCHSAHSLGWERHPNGPVPRCSRESPSTSPSLDTLSLRTQAWVLVAACPQLQARKQTNNNIPNVLSKRGVEVETVKWDIS